MVASNLGCHAIFTVNFKIFFKGAFTRAVSVGDLATMRCVFDKNEFVMRFNKLELEIASLKSCLNRTAFATSPISNRLRKVTLEWRVKPLEKQF